MAARTDLAAPESLALETRAAVGAAFLAGFRVLMVPMAVTAVAGAYVAWAAVPGRGMDAPR